MNSNLGLMTVDDVAKKYNKTRKQVYYAASTYRLSFVKVGWQTLFYPDQLPMKWPIKTKGGISDVK